MKKAVSGIMFTILLVSMLVLAFNIKPVKATGTIYIMADGSIDPPDAPIQRIGDDYYILTGNIQSDEDGIVVQRGNVTIDGNGYTILGDDDQDINDQGFYSTCTNLTIKNTNIRKFNEGIRFSCADYCTSIGNRLTNNSEGIVLIGFLYGYNLIQGNVITDNGVGIWLFYVNYSSVVGNNITGITGFGSPYGIFLHGYCAHNSIYENTIANNYVGIGMGQYYYSKLPEDNEVYHNNVINNSKQASTSQYGINSWDDGYPSGGNYWSDYNGTDLYSGTDQNMPGSDGIGDTHYVIAGADNNTDRYPLMSPYDTVPPILTILSPMNKTYSTSNVPMTFTVNEPFSWMGYNLDNHGNVTITDNTTLTGLSDGSHYMILYANDTNGNMGYSDVHFTVHTTVGGEWLQGWKYRKSHVIQHVLGAGTNYQVKIVVHYGIGSDNDANVHCLNNCRTDFGDIRFTSADGSSPLDYWMESRIDGDYAVFWVEISQNLSTEDRTIYLYYGKNDAATTSNGYNTFEFFDDFNGTILDSDIWDIIRNEGTIEVTEGFLRMYRPEDTVIHIRSVNSFSGNKAIRYRQEILQSEAERYYYSSVYYGTRPLVSSIGYSSRLGYESAIYSGDGEAPPRCGTEASTDGDIIANPPVGTWFTDELHIPSGSISRSLNYVARENSTRYMGVSGGEVGLYATSAWDDDMEHYTDWILLRKYVEPEPSHGIWGSEETHHDVAVVDVKAPKTAVGQGYSLNINVTAANQGDYTESFNVTVYANTTTVGTLFTNITLSSGNSTILLFTWNTTGFAKGNYTISAYAWQVQNETDTIDNNCTGGSVQITKVGDLGSRVGTSNVFFVCDGVVTGADLQLFRQCFKGLAPPEAMYLGDVGSRVGAINVFFVCDGVVTGADLQLFRQCYKGQGP
jgi:hypothetical protein